MILRNSFLMQCHFEGAPYSSRWNLSAVPLVLSHSWYRTDTSDMAFLRLLLAAGTTVCFYGIYKLGRQLLGPYFSPLRDLPGPKSESFMWGSLGKLQTEEYIKMHEEWVEKYGKVIKYKGFSNVSSPTHFLEVAYSIVASV